MRSRGIQGVGLRAGSTGHQSRTASYAPSLEGSCDRSSTSQARTACSSKRRSRFLGVPHVRRRRRSATARRRRVFVGYRRGMAGHGLVHPGMPRAEDSSIEIGRSRGLGSAADGGVRSARRRRPVDEVAYDQSVPPRLKWHERVRPFGSGTAAVQTRAPDPGPLLRDCGYT
jgi:hypothetical protein